MATKQPLGETALVVRRTLAAPRERVFRAWTQPEELKRWSAPGDYGIPVAQVDLRVGGGYRIEMQAPTGQRHRAVGVYREVRPPERLVYTWSWEEDPAMGETVVTVEFLDRGASTEVVLTHDLFPNAEARAQHEQGWSSCLDRLVRTLA